MTQTALKHALLLCVLVLSTALAQTETPQKISESEAGTGTTEDHWRFKFRLSKFEKQFSTTQDKSYGEWDGFIMAGRKNHGFWLSSKGSAYLGDASGSELRLFYSHNIKPYFGWAVGWRRDTNPNPQRDWLSIGVLGVLPLDIATDVNVFVGESGRLAARFSVAYRHWLASGWSLTPDFEFNYYSDDDLERSIGSGLSDIDLGLRLRYHWNQNLWPYAGVVWKGNFGTTADLIENKGEDSSDLRLTLGLSLRF